MSKYTYNQWLESCKTNARIGVEPKGMLSNVTWEGCDITVDNNTSSVLISEIVKNVIEDGMGNITNPEAIKNWRGWNNDCTI